MIKKKIKVSELKVGDIIYVIDFDEEDDYQFGEHVMMSGEDMILIIDDIEEGEEINTIYTNGGFTFTLDNDYEVYVLGHYSELIEEVENIN